MPGERPVQRGCHDHRDARPNSLADEPRRKGVGDALEVGCGTGRLTESLAGRGFELTAIDIGPAMIAAARQRVLGVSFEAVSFEDLDARLEAMWAARRDTGGAWVQTAPDARLGIHFKEPIHHDDTLQVTRSPHDVIGVENTRGLVLSWPEEVRRELRDRLRPVKEVHLTLRTLVTMAQVR